MDIIKAEAKEIAYLPVGAYHGQYEKQPVWVITLKWEYPGMGSESQPAKLGHVCVFAFNRQTLKKVGFASCG